MNHQEITAQVSNEYDKICKTTLLRVGSEYGRERKKIGINKEDVYPKEYEIKTAGKNNWIIFIHKSPGVKKYTGTKDISFLSVVYYYSDKGLKVLYKAAPGLFAGFTSHFFKRYNERLGLNLSKPIDIVKAFFRKGMYCTLKAVVRNNKPHIIGFGVDGIRLGEIRYDFTYVEWKTFVNRELAFKNQKELECKLIKDLMLELELVQEKESDYRKIMGFKNCLSVLPLPFKVSETNSSKVNKTIPNEIPWLKDFSLLSKKPGANLIPLPEFKFKPNEYLLTKFNKI